MGVFSWGLKNEFETAMVNEPSVFEPLKFYCIILCFKQKPQIKTQHHFHSEINRFYDGVEAKTRKSQASFQII